MPMQFLTMRRYPAIIFVTMALLSPVSMLHADEDHNEARKLLEAGEILSLETILGNIKPDYPGKILEVDLERKDKRMLYEMEILGDDGIVREVYVDAFSGEILSVEEDH